jgi:hypothetical protein
LFDVVRAVVLAGLVIGCAKASETGTVDGPPGSIDAGDPDAPPHIDAGFDACVGCVCIDDQTQPCYSADPGTIGVGLCVQGIQTCVGGQWDPACVGEVTPVAEACDSTDNDCNGTSDDGDPGGGGGCSTGLPGVCATGTNHCMSGGIVCVQNQMPSADVCNALDDDCNPGTGDGSAEPWFGQACDGADADACNEGALACNGAGQVCSDATGNSQTIGDPGYENGLTAGPWIKTSTQFGTPICDVGSCGTGNGTGPHAGTYWNWLGGNAVGTAETASTSQSVVIHPGTQSLTYWFEAPACDDAASVDSFIVTIDGATVFSSTNTTEPRCNMLGYVQRSIDVTAYANGAAHTIDFRGTFSAGGANVTNFFVDDVRLGCP